jgi:hypothetical protein|tara:strand:+ start:198 stop:380 length:183 start_codon:yes stop_codon:yes gene_type:complete
MIMSKSHTISVEEEAESKRGTKNHAGQQFPFGDLLKTVNAHFELLLLIAVVISVIVASIF